MKIPALHYALLCISIAMFTISCQHTQPIYHPPVLLQDGWKVGAPDKEGLDMDLLLQAAEQCRKNKKTDAFIVARHGVLIMDSYYNGYGAEDLHKVWSITKPVTAALIGIAIEKGQIASAEDSIAGYMGGYTADMPADKKNITINHLLSMNSGIAWTELGGKNGAAYKVAYSPDWIRFVLQQPMHTAPGKNFNYSSGDYMLLAPVIKNATGEQADTFAEQHLFAPLGIGDYEWVKYSEFWTKTEGGELPSVQQPSPEITYATPFANFPNTASGLKMRPRDMAKLGQLFLNKGKWQGQQVLNEAWTAMSVQPRSGNDAYGYGWRQASYTVNGKTISCFYATGFGLQCIYVFPGLDLVIVFAQQHYRDMGEGAKQMDRVLQDYILKAVKA